MNGEQATVLQLTICLFLGLPLTYGLTMPFLERNITHKDIFLRLSDVHADRQPEALVRSNLSFSGENRNESRLTLDQRCQRGLPLSVRWTNYGPYGSLIRGEQQSFKEGVGLAGIFPSVINHVLAQCCHANTRVVYGEYITTLRDLEKSLSRASKNDMMFPVGLQSMDMDTFKDLPVVPLLTAPRVTLFVPESKQQGRTLELFRTVGLAWPILVFIFLAAIVSGVFIWVLDHIANPDQFPTKFSEGVWEGFWWAVVTMTTVGYGDRAPRSILGRLFCIIWIVTGMSIIAIFTAMVTASLSASIQYNFVIHGSLMGAVDGSQEERIGTGLNAEMRTYGTPKDVVEALVDALAKTNLEVAIMDSYLLSYYHEVIKRKPVRVNDQWEQPINYGLILAPNSQNFTKCFTNYIKNNPQAIFNSIRDNLKPLKNPTDDVSEELIASQGFLGEKTFHMILYCLAGFLAGFFLLGLIWEYFISRLLCKRQIKRSTKTKKTAKSLMQSLIGMRLSQDSPVQKEELTELETIKQKSAKIRQLIREFDDFYEKWMEKLTEVTAGDEEWGNFGDKGLNEKNGSFLVVTYDGSN